MKASLVCVLLGVSMLLSALTVSAVYVSVSPNRPEFLRGESLSLSCEGVQDSARWTLKRRDYNLEALQCGGGFGRFDGSSCHVSGLSPLEDSGFYWCEDGNGRKSKELRISVSDHVILEIPALPVNVGDEVTLSCRSMYASYKLENLYREQPTKDGEYLPLEVTIKHVQLSDEGKYTCSAVQQDMAMMSEGSWLTVRVPPTPTLPPTLLPTLPPTLLPTLPPTLPSTLPPPPTLPPTHLPTLPPTPPPSETPAAPPPPPPPPSLPVVRLFCHLVVVCPYCICTVLMLSICRSRKSGTKAAVSMEMSEPAEDVVYDNVADDVITEHHLSAAQ